MVCKPDMFGKEYESTKEATPGEANTYLGIPQVVQWPGNGDIEIL